MTRIARAAVFVLAAAMMVAGRAGAQTIQSRFATVNGVRLHYLGAGNGPPIVLLHGFGESSHMW